MTSHCSCRRFAPRSHRHHGRFFPLPQLYRRSATRPNSTRPAASFKTGGGAPSKGAVSRTRFVALFPQEIRAVQLAPVYGGVVQEGRVKRRIRALALAGTEGLQQLGAVLRDALTSLSLCAQALVDGLDPECFECTAAAEVLGEGCPTELFLSWRMTLCRTAFPTPGTHMTRALSSRGRSTPRLLVGRARVWRSPLHGIQQYSWPSTRPPVPECQEESRTRTRCLHRGLRRPSRT